jgi:hypothetical protein
MTTPVTQPPETSNEIRFEIEGKTVLLLNADGMTYNGQTIQDAGEAHQLLLTFFNGAAASRRRHFVPVEEVREFAKWSEGIFHEYASLKPDEYDTPEVQAEVNASISEDRELLLRFLTGIGLRPESEDDESWIYDAEFLLEIVTNGMVEGGFMPDVERLTAAPGPSRDEMIDVVKRALARSLPGASDADEPEWVAELMKAITEDDEFMLSLCHEVCKRGWMDGRSLFDGCEMQCWTPAPDTPDNLERMRQLRGRFIPPTKPEGKVGQ